MSYFLSLLLGCFFLEDVALFAALEIMAKQQLSLEALFLACFIGINLGNMACYLIGYYISRLNLENRFRFFQKHQPRIESLLELAGPF